MSIGWSLVLTLAISWLTYRCFRIFKQPVDELEEILGVEVPTTPEVSLSTIHPTSVQLLLQPSLSSSSSTKHSVQINGVAVGHYNSTDVSTTIDGLHPGNYYAIRAVATNASGRSAYSRVIKIQTPLSDDQKEPLSGVSLKRPVGRRISSAAQQSIENATSLSSPIESSPLASKDSEQQLELTKKVEQLRKRMEEIEQQTNQEAERNATLLAEIASERNELRRQIDDRDRASHDVKKQTAEQEKQLKQLMKRKTEKEKVLKTKKDEYQRLLNETEKWRREKDQIELETQKFQDKLAKEQERYKTKAKGERAEIELIQQKIKHLDKDIKELGTRREGLEEQRQAKAREREADIQRRAEREKELERDYHERDSKYRQEYNNLITTRSELLQSNQMLSAQLQQLIASYEPVTARHMDSSSYAAGYQENSARNSRHFNYGGQNLPALDTSGESHYPFHGIDPARYAQLASLQSPAEAHIMSPSANGLLPSDLLGEEESAFMYTPNPVVMERQHSGPARPYDSPKSSSPRSAQSRPSSKLSNANDMIRGLSNHGSEPIYDPSLARSSSLRSNLSPGVPAKRNLLPFMRTNRAKLNMSDPPALGTLKQGQSQSFPRVEEMPIGAQRKNASGHWNSQIGWYRPSSGLVSKVDQGSEGRISWPENSEVEPSLGMGIYDRSSSTRPASTYSNDQALHEKRRWLWGDDKSIGQSTGWDAPTDRWSSSGLGRRQSLHHVSSNNLSVSSIPSMPEPPVDWPSKPAPIGNERGRIISTKVAAPKLNPAARPFAVPFFSKRSKTKDLQDSEANESAASGDEEHMQMHMLSPIESSSPSASRRSRDMQSDATGSRTSFENLDQSTSANGSIQASSSTSGSISKDSLLHRLTRRTSSARFSWTSSKNRSKDKDPRSSVETEGEESGRESSIVPEDGSHTPIMASPSTPTSERKQSLSWAKLRSKSGRGKKDKGALEIASSDTESMD